MGFWRFQPAIVFVLTLTWASLSHAQSGFSTIPLDNSRLPGDDLVHEGRVLKSDEAHELARQGLDLSSLDPFPNLFWSSDKKSLKGNDDSLIVDDGDTLDFHGTIGSAMGLFRFNARKGDTTVIVALDKTLHTTLLRKNILRLMGYNIPAVKWIKKLKVSFASYEPMRAFIEEQIHRSTSGAACRWIETITFASEEDKKKFEVGDSNTAVVNEECSWKITSGSENEVELVDVAVTVPGNGDFINLAFGTPPVNLSNRTWRAALIPFALSHVDESINALDWNVGRVSDGSITLPDFTWSQFATSMDDARWALNRLSSLSRDDIREAVELAHYPPEAAALLTEKLISRRNALFDLFKMKVTPLPVNKKISQGTDLVNGKLQKQYWSGYASRFSWGDPESPLKDYHWYALAKLQAIILENLMGKLNGELVLADPRDAKGDFFWGEFKRGLNHFVETGEFIEFPVKTWFSPVADASLKASRDVVVGNYLGTDNMVQIADTVGWSVRIGAHVGIEQFGSLPSGSVSSKITVNKSWSHLKPLRSLKQALKEPYRNIAVPLLKWQLKNNLRNINELKDSKDPSELDLKKKDSEISEIVRHLNQTLGKGESLLFTETINPNATAQGSTGEFLIPVDIRAQLGINANILRRIQIYRKDEKTIQVYDDRGNSRGWTFDVALQKYIPLIQTGFSKTKGDYGIRLYEVNIDPDIKENPKLFEGALALATFIQSGSSELLASLQKPHRVDAEFEDKSTRFALLAWRLRKLKTTTTFDIKSRDGLEGKFIAFTDEKQTGWNWEAFAKDLINFGMNKIVSGVEWGGNPFQNPAETIMGVGETRSVRFEAAIDDKGAIEERFLRLTDRWEGWSASVGKVTKKMRELNSKFGTTIFNEDSLGNMDKLRLFNVAVNLNLYEQGVQRLSEMSEDKLILIENRYEVARRYHEKGCPGRPVTRRLSSGRSFPGCGLLSSVISQNRECQKLDRKNKSDTQVNRCLTRFLRVLYEDVEYKDIETLVGKDNIFVHGSINGFRNGDEVLNETIQGNTEGRIGGEFWNGPFEVIQRLLGISGGEFNGVWMRERI